MVHSSVVLNNVQYFLFYVTYKSMEGIVYVYAAISVICQKLLLNCIYSFFLQHSSLKYIDAFIYITEVSLARGG